MRLKIERSKSQNATRIEKMKAINEITDSLKAELKKDFNEQMKQNKNAYKELLKKLMIQGLIKMMEASIVIRCREADKEMIQGILNESIATYRQMIVEQVVKFKGKEASEIPCKVKIDEKFLESVENNEQSGCYGGFKMFAKKGRIVLSQTIDDRIDLCFQAAIPAIRYMLFPTMRKQEK